ncbi:hypothetical protein D8B26_000377 [Coccidioides posadasii str. Silveira]|uniref:Tse2 ADP-ribosyltransferase toxin domain-containing protein n=1 Tax=Coccidioides posadasii (strain RMSCC 757 / Silveira) TaxID=443226 RepID=E9DF89_COCPS|nr:conserved hypothetical protein [Coccidioides posadasii str. Silveira]QVM05671.1 hypothetical protein D8B26_000377 [Coccidioides posadasii str. Silveira]
MFRAFLHTTSARAGLSASPLNRRSLSYASQHSVFPATLYRFQIHRRSDLYDRRLEQDDWEYEDGVEVSDDDGLVRPKVAPRVSNGALFMPNTHFMQEITRRSFDNYLDGVDSGKPTAEPHYLCIPQGTSIPNVLTLFREQASRFSLQPSYPMTLAALNEALTKFYSESGHVIAAEEWLDKNPYHEAGFDDSEDWMSK